MIGYFSFRLNGKIFNVVHRPSTINYINTFSNFLTTTACTHSIGRVIDKGHNNAGRRKVSSANRFSQ